LDNQDHENVNVFWSYLGTAKKFRDIINFVESHGKLQMPQTHALWISMLKREFLKVEESYLELAMHYSPSEELANKLKDELRKL
jgi:hypothetical protein